MKSLALAAVLAFTLHLSGCASAPDVGIGYYLPKGDAALVVTQRLYCFDTTEAGIATPQYLSRVSYAVEQSFSNDTSQKYYLNPKKMGGVFADSKLTITFQDGRIKNISSDFTGKGEAVIGGSIDLFGVMMKKQPAAADADPVKKACNIIKERVSAPKETTIRFVDVQEKFALKECDAAIGEEIPLCPESEKKSVLHPLIKIEDVSALMSEIEVNIEYNNKQETGIPIDYSSDCDVDKESLSTCALDASELVAAKPKYVEFHASAERDGTVIHEKRMVGRANLPQYGQRYLIPLPVSVFFGGGEAVIDFNEAGELKKITYNSRSGADDFNKAFDKLSGELSGPDASEEAAEYKNKADAIYQKNRLENCQLNPTECAK